MDSIFVHYFALQLVGLSSTGKTVFVKEFLYNMGEICTVTFDRILFYYEKWQVMYHTKFSVTNKKI